MRACLLLASLLSIFSHFAAPQTAPVTVKVRVLIVDKDLNQKPVPFYIVQFHNAGNADPSTAVKTDLEGKAERQLPPGRYSITTPKPVELGGKRYSWNLQVQFTGVEQRVDLTNDNAKIEDLPAATPPGETKSSSGAAGGELTALFNNLKN